MKNFTDLMDSLSKSTSSERSTTSVQSLRNYFDELFDPELHEAITEAELKNERTDCARVEEAETQNNDYFCADLCTPIPMLTVPDNITGNDINGCASYAGGFDLELMNAPVAIERGMSDGFRSTPSLRIPNLYNIALMSSLANDDKNLAEPYTIYLSNEGRYVVRSIQDPAVVHDAMLSGVDLTNLRRRINNVTLYKAVLEGTSANGHTDPNYALYHDYPKSTYPGSPLTNSLCSFFSVSTNTEMRSLSSREITDAPPIPPASEEPGRDTNDNRGFNPIPGSEFNSTL